MAAERIAVAGETLVVHRFGILFARWRQRMVQAGMAVAKIAGEGAGRSGGKARLLD